MQNTVIIHLARLGKPERAYREGLLADDGVRMKTYTIISEAVSLHLSEKFHLAGRLDLGARIISISKHHFYQEWFSIIEYRDQAGQLLGYYCDIVTPLRKEGGEYYLTDLILDLWIAPDLQFEELDRDEFEAGITSGLITPQLARTAHHTVERLKNEIRLGLFPAAYLNSLP